MVPEVAKSDPQPNRQGTMTQNPTVNVREKDGYEHLPVSCGASRSTDLAMITGVGSFQSPTDRENPDTQANAQNANKQKQNLPQAVRTKKGG